MCPTDTLCIYVYKSHNMNYKHLVLKPSSEDNTEEFSKFIHYYFVENFDALTKYTRIELPHIFAGGVQCKRCNTKLVKFGVSCATCFPAVWNMLYTCYSLGRKCFGHDKYFGLKHPGEYIKALRMLIQFYNEHYDETYKYVEAYTREYGAIPDSIYIYASGNIQEMWPLGSPFRYLVYQIPEGKDVPETAIIPPRYTAGDSLGSGRSGFQRDINPSKTIQELEKLPVPVCTETQWGPANLVKMSRNSTYRGSGLWRQRLAYILQGWTKIQAKEPATASQSTSAPWIRQTMSQQVPDVDPTKSPEIEYAAEIVPDQATYIRNYSEEEEIRANPDKLKVIPPDLGIVSKSGRYDGEIFMEQRKNKLFGCTPIMCQGSNISPLQWLRFTKARGVNINKELGNSMSSL